MGNEAPLGAFRSFVVGYPSGQRGQTVNLLAMPSNVRIVDPPPFLFPLRAVLSRKVAVKKFFQWAVAVIFLTLMSVGVATWVAPQLAKGRALAAERDALKAENERLETQIAELRRKQDAFRNNPDYVEIVARREGFTRGDEVVFDFTDAVPEKQ